MSSQAEIAQSGEQNVVLNQGSGGSAVRTLDITTVQPDGSLLTVQMQVIAITDKSGRILNFDGIESTLEDILHVLEEIRDETVLGE
jgi:hypothetical protein